MAVGRVIGSVLYATSPGEPSAFLGAAALLLRVALGAAYVPARRAAGIDPMEALRHE